MPNKYFTRLQYVLIVLFVLIVVSCKKENVQQDIPSLPEPEMEYFNLNDKEVKANATGFSIDVNHDGRKDLAFSTLLVGDPVNQVDKLLFLVSSNIKANLPVNADEEIPVLNFGDSVLPDDFNGYHWFELSSIVLIQKVVSFTGPDVWEGHWRNAVHNYLPYQVVAIDKVYNGWVELSVDIANEKIILHKAAVCKESNKIIKAGK